jgi:membrane protease YdiL (CAAX protease family)
MDSYNGDSGVNSELYNNDLNRGGYYNDSGGGGYYNGDEEYNPYVITSANTLTAEEAKKEIRKCSTRNSLILLLLFVFMNITAVVSSMFFEGEKFEMFMYLLNYALAFPLCLLIANAGKKNKVMTFIQQPRITKKQWFQWSCIGYALTITVNIVSVTTFTFVDVIFEAISGDNLNMVSQIPQTEATTPYLIIYFIAIGICAPVFEELLLRGSCLTGTLKYGQWFSFSMIGIFFGILHGNFQQMFYAMAIGIILGFIAFKSKSVLPAIATHMFLNVPAGFQGILQIKMAEILSGVKDETGLTLSELSKRENRTKEVGEQLADYFFSPNIIPFILYFLIVLTLLTFFVIGIILFILKARDKKEEFFCGNACPVLTTKQKVIAYLSSPASIIFIILIVANSVLVALG